MTTKQMRKFNSKLQDLLNEFGAENDVALKIKSCRFDNAGFSMKVEGAFESDDTSGEEALFASAAKRIAGVSAEDYGRTFRNKGREFRIVELNTRAKKYPVIAETKRGARYKFPVSVIR